MNVFKKGKFLIACFVSVSIFFVLSVSSFQGLYLDLLKRGNKNFIPKESLSVMISGNRTLNRELFSFFNGFDDDVILFKLSGGIYFKKDIFSGLKLTAGKKISKEDILNQKNYMLKNKKEGNPLSEKKVGEKWYVNSLEYEIVGTLNDQNLPDEIYVLFSKNSDHLATFNDRIIIYSKNGSDKLLDNLTDFLKSNPDNKDLKIRVNRSENSNSSSVFTNLIKEISFSILILSILIGLLSLNTINAVKYLIENHKSLITIKRLCGASKSRIFLEFIGRYALIISAGFLIGTSILMLSKLSYLSKLFPITNPEVYVESALVSYIFCLICGFVTALPLIIKYCNNQISKMMRD